MAESLRRAGMEDAEAAGADGACRRALPAGDRPHATAQRALAMGLQACPVADPEPGEKAVLRWRSEAIRAEASAPPGIEAALDALGVVRPGGRAPGTERSSG